MSEIQGYYGSGNTPCIIYVYECEGVNWYACEGASGVNATYDDIETGVNIEALSDIDFFTADYPIESSDSLELEVCDYLDR